MVLDKLAKARLEINATANAARRALTAIDAAIDAERARLGLPPT